MGALVADRKAYYAEYRAENRDSLRKKHADYSARNHEAIKARRAEHYAANRGEVRKYMAAWYAANPNRYKRRYQINYANSKKRHYERSRQWAKTNPQRVAELQAAYRDRQKKLRAESADHRAKMRARDRTRYHEKRDKVREQRRLAYLRNRKKICNQVRDYRKRNPHMVLKFGATRRLRVEATVENEHAVEHFVKLIRSSKTVACYYCKKPVSGKRAHIDHIIPLSRSGTHTVGNLCASCPRCNNTKHAKLLSEWKREGQQVLPI